MLARCSPACLLHRSLRPADLRCVSSARSAGAAIVKVPQILNMLIVGSAQGISFQATFTEFLGNTWVSAYNAQMGNPLSSYGEAPLIAVQNLVILALILILGAGSAKIASGSAGVRPGVLALIVYVVVFALGQLVPWVASLAAYVDATSPGDYSCLADVESVFRFVWGRVGVVKPEGVAAQILQALFLGNTALFAMARLPQILTNFSNGHMGTQSIVTLFLQAAGTAARVLTSWVETGDLLVTGCFALSAVLNITLFVQFLMYWTSTGKWRKEQRDGNKQKRE